MAIVTNFNISQLKCLKISEFLKEARLSVFEGKLVNHLP